MIHPIIVRESPNQGSRPVGAAPSLIVIHGSAGRDAGDLSWIMSAASKVSYHELIHRDGTVFELVNPLKRAWHAGKSSWSGRSNVNDFSIGIALSNLGPSEPAYTEMQYFALVERVRANMDRFHIPVSSIVGHHMISGPRVRTDPKSDPWEHFDWERFFYEIIHPGGVEYGQWFRIAIRSLSLGLAQRAREYEWWRK